MESGDAANAVDAAESEDAATNIVSRVATTTVSAVATGARSATDRADPPHSTAKATAARTQ